MLLLDSIVFLLWIVAASALAGMAAYGLIYMLGVAVVGPSCWSPRKEPRR